MSRISQLAFLGAMTCWTWSGVTKVGTGTSANAPWSFSSELAVEWSVVALGWVIAALLAHRASRFSVAIGVPTSILGVLIVLNSFSISGLGNSHSLGTLLSIVSLGCGVVAVLFLLSSLVGHVGLTRSGLITTLSIVAPALVWAVAFGPSWWITTYTVIGTTFASTGTSRLTIASGSIFSAGLSSVLVGLGICVAPLALVSLATFLKDTGVQISCAVMTGCLMTSIAADSFFGDGAQPRSFDPRWAGWIHHGEISITATAWNWIALSSGLLLLILSLIVLGWRQTSVRGSAPEI